MKHILIRFKLIVFMLMGSLTSISGQVDSLTQHVVSNLKPAFFEIQSHLGWALPEDESDGLGVHINLGIQRPISKNKTLSILGGLNASYKTDLAINLSGRFSNFKHYTESYLESGFIISTSGKNTSSRSSYIGYNISIGQKYHSYGLGLFISYDRLFFKAPYYQVNYPNEHYFKIGVTTHKKTAFAGIISILGYFLYAFSQHVSN